MRLLIAALSFFISLFLIASALMALLPAGAPQWQTNVGVLLSFLLSLFITNKLTNAPGTKFWSFSRAPEPGEQSEEEGLLVSTAYRATRYFQVEESQDEGPHYFIELHDGPVLYLNGQYLAAFGPRKIFNVIAIPRKFPCTDFVVIRDRYEGRVADVQCRGSVLEPEIVTPPFAEPDLEGVMTLQDGDLITSRTYEEMKALISRERSR